MEQLYVTSYRYRDGLDADDLSELTKKFMEIGDTPGTIAHYSRFDGQGGFVVRKDTGEQAKVFEVIARYSPWIEFEIFPVTTIEESFPVIQSVYG